MAVVANVVVSCGVAPIFLYAWEYDIHRTRNDGERETQTSIWTLVTRLSVYPRNSQRPAKSSQCGEKDTGILNRRHGGST